MIIPYSDFYFEIDRSDIYNVNVFAKPDPDSFKYLWEGHLKGLWRDKFERETADLSKVWNMHLVGDYFQKSITRRNKDLHKHQSYTAMFHDLVRNNRADLSFIQNIYSTSGLNWLSFGYTLYGDGKHFWVKQQEQNLAEYTKLNNGIGHFCNQIILLLL